MLGSMGTTTSTFLANMAEIIMFNLAGFLAGFYRDAKQGYIRTLKMPYRPAAVECKRSFLLYMDGTSGSLYAAEYIACLWAGVKDLGITIIWFPSGYDEDFYESPEVASVQAKEEYQKGESLVNQAKDILLRGGIPEGNISLNIVAKKVKSNISDRILEELRKTNCDSVVIAKHPRNKAQEFLIGSTTINLVRADRWNVIAVKVPKEASKQ